jgi:hypothetical protein
MWEDLHEIETLFNDLNGRDRYEYRLLNWANWRAAASAAHRRAWRQANRERDRLTKRRYEMRHRAHIREVWKRNAAAYRARKRALRISK